VNQINKA